jgi:hypothetical protein
MVNPLHGIKEWTVGQRNREIHYERDHTTNQHYHDLDFFLISLETTKSTKTDRSLQN